MISGLPLEIAGRMKGAGETPRWWRAYWRAWMLPERAAAAVRALRRSGPGFDAATSRDSAKELDNGWLR